MRRWLFRLALSTTLVGVCIYLGGFYLLFEQWPWQRSDGAASLVLSEAAQSANVPDGAVASLPPRSLQRVNRSVPSTRSQAIATTPVIEHGQLQNVSFTSQILGAQRPMLVYLPPRYDQRTDRYPVLYLLHGAPGQYDDWARAAGIDQTLDALISVGRIPPLIVVLPDGNGGLLGDTEWANNADGSVRVEDYVVQEIVPWIDQNYRTLADANHRAIGGLSTGGFGAANIALHHPDLFHYVLSLSGNFMAAPTWTGKDVWGGNADLKAYNSPLLYAPKAPTIRRLHFFLTVGSSETDGTVEQTQQFAAVLDRLRVPHTLRLFPGKHTWTFWKTHIVDALDYLAQTMGQTNEAHPGSTARDLKPGGVRPV